MMSWTPRNGIQQSYPQKDFPEKTRWRFLMPVKGSMQTSILWFFFRERKALLSSHYRTAIKTGARVCCTADAFIPFWFERSDVFNYDALIRRWRDPFGDDNVHVLSYDQVVENNNSADRKSVV